MRKISAAIKAWCTSSSLSGGMMATINFMARLPSSRSVQVQQAVAMLAVQLVVHAGHLARGAEAQTEQLLHQGHQRDRQDGGIHDGDRDAQQLHPQLGER